MVSDVDLRRAVAPPGDPSCGFRERYDAASGECLPCSYLLPHPFAGCPCAWTYQPGPPPYCDTPDAYYECGACTGGIESCNAYDRFSGTGRNCPQLARCCAELAATPGATPCCAAGESLACVLDLGASGAENVFRLGCLPEPCCIGVPCPGGAGDCQPWQSCVAGACTPACEPGVRECQVLLQGAGLGCQCVDVVSPP